MTTRFCRHHVFAAVIAIATCCVAFLTDPAAAQICNNTASCVVVHTTPGCNSPDCCNQVCAVDPSCCGFGGWDSACVLAANQVCVGYPGAAASGSCFSPHTNPNCDSAECCTAVCAFDPFCCSTAWDLTCSQTAGFACQGTPGQCGSPTAGSCFAAHAQGACDDATCCTAVCNLDPSCCSAAWDALCVIEAEQVCVSGCEPVADPNGRVESEACGSRANDPCYATTGGAPEPLTPGIQVRGTLGSEIGTNVPNDVDVYSVVIPDSDADGLAKVSITFASSPKAWVALVPTTVPCAPMSSALVHIASELCVDTNSTPTCIPAGTYRLVVGAGTFPQFGGSAINCSGTNKYTLRVDVTQACGNACTPNAGSCFVARSSRGCGNPQCCASVCAADSFCCDQAWDASCVQLAGNLCLSGPPANDLCATPAPLMMGTQTFNTVRAGLELRQNATACGGSTFSRDVWYSWTSDRNGAVSIEACNPWFDTLLAVYTGDCAKLSILACNDNASFCGTIGSRVTFAAACGQRYLVRVGPRQGAGGEATIALSSSAPVCATCAADLNGDRQVNAQDLAALLSGWGTTAGDVNRDGVTNAFDLSILLSTWGPCP